VYFNQPAEVSFGYFKIKTDSDFRQNDGYGEDSVRQLADLSEPVLNLIQE